MPLNTIADKEQANAFEAELFQPKTRLSGAERALATKPTGKAENDQRIATDKIARAQRNLADLQRITPLDRDARIFPSHHAQVMIMKNGRRLIVPMRYECRLPGWTEAMEKQKPGTYNARRDNLDKAWRKLFGFHHGLMVVTRFYENVERAGENQQKQMGPDNLGDLLARLPLSEVHTSTPACRLASVGQVVDDVVRHFAPF
ncbi:hypothetical protein [Cupriavidus sp. CuC1]|uniref:hypothetical protein n=1 Tax=Cupriavidus sp. CuC1 TaxID=3373131 RepID=UPI0037D34864